MGTRCKMRAASVRDRLLSLVIAISVGPSTAVVFAPAAAWLAVKGAIAASGAHAVGAAGAAHAASTGVVTAAGLHSVASAAAAGAHAVAAHPVATGAVAAAGQVVPMVPEAITGELRKPDKKPKLRAIGRIIQVELERLKEAGWGRGKSKSAPGHSN